MSGSVVLLLVAVGLGWCVGAGDVVGGRTGGMWSWVAGWAGGGSWWVGAGDVWVVVVVDGQVSVLVVGGCWVNGWGSGGWVNRLCGVWGCTVGGGACRG